MKTLSCAPLCWNFLHLLNNSTPLRSPLCTLDIPQRLLQDSKQKFFPNISCFYPAQYWCFPLWLLAKSKKVLEKKKKSVRKIGSSIKCFQRNKKPVILYKEWLITNLSAFELENYVYNAWFYPGGPVRAVLD